MTHSHHLWFLTDFGDQAVVLPLAVVMAAALLFSGWRRGALVWSIGVPATLLAVGLAKLLIFRFGSPAVLPDLLSPSGHTASAALVYGGLAAMMLRGAVPWRRALLGAVPLAVLIGGTRLALGVHTPDDVLAGGLIGVAGAIGLAWFAGDRPHRISAWPPAAVMLIVFVLFHGIRLPAEAWLHAAAQSWQAGSL